MTMDHSDISTDDGSDGLHGVYIGIVSDIEDPENMARVKLKFPWLKANYKSDWARLATTMAGKNMGTFFIPEKGDEVLVAFGQGNIREPYVIGSLWNGKEAPPLKSKKKNPVRQIRSRAGHTITLDDTANNGNIEIETKKDQRVIIDDKKDEIKIQDSNGNKITMGKDGIEIKSKNKTTLSGNEVEINADQKLSLSGGQLDASASSKATISSRGPLDLSANGKASLKAFGLLQITSTGPLQMKGLPIMLN